MTRPFLLLPLLLTLSCNESPPPPDQGAPPAAPPTPTALDTAAKAMAKELKQELLTALGNGGPVKAISVCRDKAPALAAAHSARTGWTIRRTALRLRNPDNAPDPWERTQLEAFQQQLANGADPASLTAYEIVDGQSRFARAIPTAPECLLCHGTTLDPTLASTIKAAYPDDQATGFAVGELRGIFSVMADQE